MRAMTALAEDDEEEESDDRQEIPHQEEHTAAPPQEGNDKPETDTGDKQPSPDVKDTADPLAALGDKLAKLRYFEISSVVT